MSSPVWVVEEQDNKLYFRRPNTWYKDSNWKPVAAYIDLEAAKEYIRNHHRPWAVRLEFYFSPNFWKRLKDK